MYLDNAILSDLQPRGPEWPWSQAYVKHTGVMGTPRKILNLATVIMNGTEVFSKHEWTWNRWYPLLKGKAG